MEPNVLNPEMEDVYDEPETYDEEVYEEDYSYYEEEYNDSYYEDEIEYEDYLEEYEDDNYSSVSKIRSRHKEQ